MKQGEGEGKEVTGNAWFTAVYKNVQSSHFFIFYCAYVVKAMLQPLVTVILTIGVSNQR
jgi:hypothetical protein